MTGDLGFSVFEDFILKYPDRFINAGIAEQNMMGVAAGLSHSGKKVFTYSIIPFSLMRCLEQIKIDICYRNADVKIIGIGSGFAYGALGVTHHAVEDIAVIRGFPNITVLSPCDASETRACLDLAVKSKGPFYIRLGKNREPKIHASMVKAVCGGSNIIKEGKDVTILVTGSIAWKAMAASKMLEEKGISTRVVSMYSLKPIDEKAVLHSCRKTPVIVSVEEHNIIGGLGSAVSEIIAESGSGVSFRRLGIRDTFACGIGSQDYLLDKHGLGAEDIFKFISNLIKKR